MSSAAIAALGIRPPKVDSLNSPDAWHEWAAAHNLKEIVDFRNVVRACLAEKVSGFAGNDVDDIVARSAMENYKGYLATATFLMVYSYFEEDLYLLWKRIAKDVARGGENSIKRYQSVLAWLEGGGRDPLLLGQPSHGYHLVNPAAAHSAAQPRMAATCSEGRRDSWAVPSRSQPRPARRFLSVPVCVDSAPAVTTGRGVKMSALRRLTAIRGGGVALETTCMQAFLVGRRRVELRTP